MNLTYLLRTTETRRRPPFVALQTPKLVQAFDDSDGAPLLRFREHLSRLYLVRHGEVDRGDLGHGDAGKRELCFRDDTRVIKPLWGRIRARDRAGQRLSLLRQLRPIDHGAGKAMATSVLRRT